MEISRDELILNCRNPQGEAGKQTIERMNESHSELTDWGISHISIGKKDSVLDVGCGGGAALKKIAEMNPAGKCYGVDISDLSIAEAEKMNEAAVKDGRMSFQKADVGKLPFADGSMDAVISVESYYFWPDPEGGLREICRVLRDGGHLLIVLEYRAEMEKDEDYRHNQSLLHMNVPGASSLMAQFQDAGLCRVRTDIRGNWLCAVGEK
jgi:ubiquinone/menaquinone biosynthesis C-methylase UbiE